MLFYNFGGGFQLNLNKEDLKFLVDKLNTFSWSNVENFTIESDPRRVDEDRLIFNAEQCGANRISLMQDFDINVQKELIEYNQLSFLKIFLLIELENYIKKLHLIF